MTKARQTGVRKVNEMKIKVRETSGDHQGYIEWIEKSSISGTYRLKTEERTKDGGKSSRNYP